MMQTPNQRGIFTAHSHASGDAGLSSCPDYALMAEVGRRYAEAGGELLRLLDIVSRVEWQRVARLLLERTPYDVLPVALGQAVELAELVLMPEHRAINPMTAAADLFMPEGAPRPDDIESAHADAMDEPFLSVVFEALEVRRRASGMEDGAIGVMDQWRALREAYAILAGEGAA